MIISIIEELSNKAQFITMLFEDWGMDRTGAYNID
jgi:hypothetical protein